MKTLFRTLILAATATAALISCSKGTEVDDQTTNKIDSSFKFFAYVEDAATRATLTPNEGDTKFTAAWEDEEMMDLIATCSAQGFSELGFSTWNADDQAFDAIFNDVEIPGGVQTWHYNAYYPYYESAPFDSPRIQTGNEYNSVFDIMYGETEVTAEFGKKADGSPLEITMNRLTGIAYFHITNGPNEDVVSATLSAEGIAADILQFSFDGGTPIVTPTKDATVLDEITITFAEGTAPKATDLKLWFNVLPGTYSNLKLTIVTENHTAVLAPSASITYTAGKLNKAVLSGLTWSNTEQFFEKVTSLDMIADGAQYVIGAWKGDAFYAIPVNPTVNSGKITGVTVPVGTNGIAFSDATDYVWTLTKEGNSWILTDGTNYLYHSNGGNSGTNLACGTTASFMWDISVGEGSRFKFAGVNNGVVKDRGLLFNGTVFGGYALSNFTASDYSGIDLYVFAGEDQRTDVTLSFDNASYELSIGTEGYTNFGGQVVTTAPAGVTGVKYALTGAVIGSLDEDTGAITLDGTTVGEATITASFAGNSTYKPATSVSYTITVDDPRCVTLDWTYPTGGEAATRDGINAIAGVKTYGLGTDYAESHAPYRIKFDNTDDYIQVKTDVAIGEVTVAYKKIGGANNSTLKIQESVDGEDFTDVEVLTLTGAKDATGTVSTTNVFDSDSRYVKILFNKVDNVGIGGITINKVDNTPRFTVESPLEAAAAAGDYNVNVTRKFFTGAITVTAPTGCDWIVPGNVAANANSFSVHVNANTGESRTATLTLSADGVTSQELVVNQAGVQPGTEANPYTVAQALALIETLGGDTSSTVWVTGTVSNVESFSSKYHSITYFISDDGTNTSALEVYSGKGLDDANFTDITNLAVGDKLVVKGTLQKYNGTPEFTQSSIITSIVSQAPRYTVTLGSVTPANSGTISASATSVGAQGVVTLTATPETGYKFDEWTVTNLTTNQTIAVSNENKFIMPAANVSVSATFVSNQGDEEVSWVLVKSINDLAANDEIIIANVAGTSAIGPQASSNRTGKSVTAANEQLTAIDNAVVVITLEGSADNWMLNTGTGYLYASSSSANQLKESSATTVGDNGKWTISINSTNGEATFVANGTNTRNYMRFNPNNGSPIFACYASTSTTGTLTAIYKKVTN